MSHTPGPWTYGVRRDGSIWISLGNPETGPHRQFDFYSDEGDARLAMAAPEMYEALKNMLTVCKSLDVYLKYGAVIQQAQDALDKAVRS